MTTHLDETVGRAPQGRATHTAPSGRAENLVTPTARRTTGDDVIPAGAPSAPSRWLAVLRLATGALFLWPFFDKMFGLGYGTPAERAVLEGNSPTRGFLSHLDVGPGKGFFTSIAGAWWADWLFMIGLGAVGIAVIAGVGLRLSAIAGSLLMMMMWFAEWPLARFTESGTPTGSTNPLVDYHVIYALALIVVAATAAGTVWGLGKKWAALPLVQRHQWLK